MNEFELYSRILSDDFKCKNQELLYESKSGQRASIEGKGIDGYELYRFDAEEGKDFLPFSIKGIIVPEKFQRDLEPFATT